MKVAILYNAPAPDAPPDELDVLAQREAVAHALSELGHQPTAMPFSFDLPAVVASLDRLRPDCVFNLVESVESRGRLIFLAPALLDSRRLPYTGADAEAMFLSSNKILTKQVLSAHGLPTPVWFSPETLTRGDLGAGGRYIIKSVWEDASLGIDDDSLIETDQPAVLRREILARADRLGGEAFAEAYIEGRELNLAMLARDGEAEVLSPAEIRFVDYAATQPRIVGYRAKWEQGSMEYWHTPCSFDFPATDGPLLEVLTQLARRCWELLGLDGYARVDFRVDTEGRPWILEVNANPCLSPDAGFVAAGARSGLDLGQVVQRLVQDALRRSGRQ